MVVPGKKIIVKYLGEGGKTVEKEVTVPLAPSPDPSMPEQEPKPKSIRFVAPRWGGPSAPSPPKEKTTPPPMVEPTPSKEEPIGPRPVVETDYLRKEKGITIPLATKEEKKVEPEYYASEVADREIIKRVHQVARKEEPTPMPEMTEPMRASLGTPGAAKRAEYVAEESIIQTITEFKETHEPKAQEVTEREYARLQEGFLISIGMTRGEGGTWQYTDPGQLRQWEEQEPSIKQRAIEAGEQYYQEQWKRTTKTIYISEFKEAGFVPRETDEGLGFIPIARVEAEQRFEAEQKAIERRMSGEEGLSGYLLELGRFWYSGFTPENLLYHKTIGEILFGEEKGKRERILFEYTQSIVKTQKAVEEYGWPGAYIRPYEPGGFGFMGTVATVVVGGFGIVGAAGATAKGTVGTVLSSFASKAPWVISGVMSGTIGAEFGYTAAMEEKGLLPLGATGKKILERTTQIGLMATTGYLATKPSIPIVSEKTVLGIYRHTPAPIKQFSHQLKTELGQLRFQYAKTTGKGLYKPSELTEPYPSYRAGSPYARDIQQVPYSKITYEGFVPKKYLVTGKKAIELESHLQVVPTKEGKIVDIGKISKPLVSRKYLFTDRRIQELIKPIKAKPLIETGKVPFRWHITEEPFITTQFKYGPPTPFKFESPAVPFKQIISGGEQVAALISKTPTFVTGMPSISTPDVSISPPQLGDGWAWATGGITLAELEILEEGTQYIHPRWDKFVGKPQIGISSVSLKQISAISTDQISGVLSEKIKSPFLDQLFVSKELLKTESMLDQELGLKGITQEREKLSEVALIQGISPISIQAQAQAKLQIQSPMYLFKQAFTPVFTIDDLSISKPEITHKPKPKPFWLPSLMKEKGVPGDQAYAVLVKERYIFEGKKVRPERLVKIKIHPLIETEAHALGQHLTEHSAAQTYTIRPVAGSPKPLRLDIDFGLGHKFYKKGKDFIERREYAIDTPGEKQEITAQSIFSGMKKDKRLVSDLYRLDIGKEMEKQLKEMRGLYLG